MKEDYPNTSMYLGISSRIIFFRNII